MQDRKYDFEVLAQTNNMTLLQEAISSGQITLSIRDSQKRNLLHHCCIFNNATMLSYLFSVWSVTECDLQDYYQVSLTHIAARNGSLECLKILDQQKFLSNEREIRYGIHALEIAISMKHHQCVEFLIPKSSLPTLNSALLTSCYEGNYELVKSLVKHGAEIETGNFYLMNNTFL